MAYNNGFPVGYQQVYYPTQYQPMQYGQQMPQAQPGQQNQQVNQIQNGGFIPVRTEAEARAYPVAPGMSVTFKHESAPYCYTKTMGFNQFEAPRFDKYRLVKEDEAPEEADQSPTAFATQSDLAKLAEVVKGFDALITGIKTDIETMKGDLYGVAGRKKLTKKSEVTDDDA